MDSCECEEQKNSEGEKSEDGDSLPFSRNFFPTSRIRYYNKSTLRLWNGLLAYNVYFLPIISLFFWIIFLVFKS